MTSVVPRTFYIASSRDRIDDVRALAADLERWGLSNSFAWHDHFNHHCATNTCGIADRADLARRELSAAGSCDLFVGIARLGKGSHVELGAAESAVILTGRPKRIILVGLERLDSVFYDAHGIEHVANLTELRQLLAKVG